VSAASFWRNTVGRRSFPGSARDTALKRVWSAVRISWYLTTLLHRFPDSSDFDQRAQEYELEYLKSSRYAQIGLAEQYAGLPFD
jgi:p-hydroxybenzoate 3-monooxygenase